MRDVLYVATFVVSRWKRVRLKGKLYFSRALLVLYRFDLDQYMHKYCPNLN